MNLSTEKSREYEINLIKKKEAYLSYIVEAIGMDSLEFLQNLLRNQPYEVMLYQWVDRFYNKEINKQEALERILKLLNRYMRKMIQLDKEYR